VTLEADVHEPKEFLKLAAPSVPVAVEILNERGWADYKWQGRDGGYTQVERKTWPEILASVDAVEDQLRRHRKNQPDARLLFVLEGMVATDSMGTYNLRSLKDGTLWTRGYKSGTRLSRIYSWMYAASEYVEIFQTFDYTMTVQFLVQAYKYDQKEETEKKTFNRYFKKISFHPNPQVMQLMGLIPGLGEVKAEALIARFTTVWQVLNAPPADLMDVPGIGPRLAHDMLRRIGRYDV
jgi:ERCC4-type nuclease